MQITTRRAAALLGLAALLTVAAAPAGPGGAGAGGSQGSPPAHAGPPADADDDADDDAHPGERGRDRAPGQQAPAGDEEDDAPDDVTPEETTPPELDLEEPVIAGDDSNGSIDGTDDSEDTRDSAIGDDGKILVCKSIANPGQGERPQTGNGPIAVDANSNPIYRDSGDVKVGDSWQDAHGESLVVAPGTTTCEAPVNEAPEQEVPVDDEPISDDLEPSDDEPIGDDLEPSDDDPISDDREPLDDGPLSDDPDEILDLDLGDFDEDATQLDLDAPVSDDDDTLVLDREGQEADDDEADEDVAAPDDGTSVLGVELERDADQPGATVLAAQQEALPETGASALLLTLLGLLGLGAGGGLLARGRRTD